ncbi:MAG: ATP-dependent DNA helicase RecG [Deltaproteobacteria bacterium]|nr:ATP-dependent DNA helicase RecG [Deltaproteobacteria bacterium]
MSTRIRVEDAQLQTPLAALLGVGPKTTERLLERGLATVQDALFFLPTRYERWFGLSTIASLEVGISATVRGTVKSSRVRFLGRGRRMFDLVVQDETASILCRFFQFHQGTVSRFPAGTDVFASGTISLGQGIKQMIHPELRAAWRTGDEEEESGRHKVGWVPVYSEIEGVRAGLLRGLLQGLARAAASEIVDPLPAAVRMRHGLLSLREAVGYAHNPPPPSSDGPVLGAPALDATVLDAPILDYARRLGDDPRAEPRRRLVFDDLFYLFLAIETERRHRADEPGLMHRSEVAWRDLASEMFPFALTSAQAEVVDTLAQDLASARPMHRLLQGDVGCGKTAVAWVACAIVAKAGRQSVMLVPTEVLAEQHFQRAQASLGKLGLRVACLSGSTDRRTRMRLLASLSAMEIDVLIGTHAVLEESVVFGDLGLCVIDEQHRFGVAQREVLKTRRQDGLRPDVLVMTATPIPRTLALTLYGDLDVSVIAERPLGTRGAVATEVVVASTPAFTLKSTSTAASVSTWSAETERVFDAVRVELEAGNQAYVLFPLVEASEKLDLLAAKDGAASLSARFAPWKLALLHGRMKPSEKREVMRAFEAGEVRVLVCTTVVEVGVDVSAATVMVVYGAERFGLSQLHQLRGRVGRGERPGRCYLVAVGESETSRARLAILETADDGFAIAEHDFLLRGAGEMTGGRQAGANGLSVADLARDRDMIDVARAEARRCLDEDPVLTSDVWREVGEVLRARYPEGARWSGVG